MARGGCADRGCVAGINRREQPIYLAGCFSGLHHVASLTIAPGRKCRMGAAWQAAFADSNVRASFGVSFSAMSCPSESLRRESSGCVGSTLIPVTIFFGDAVAVGSSKLISSQFSYNYFTYFSDSFPVTVRAKSGDALLSSTNAYFPLTDSFLSIAQFVARQKDICCGWPA